MRRSLILILFVLPVIISSCGTTYISLSREVSGGNVYVDGKNYGSAPVKITRTGAPAKKVIRVTDSGGKEITTTVIKRKVKPGTVIWGLLFLPAGYTGIAFFIFDWKFDKKIVIDIPAEYQKVSPWDQPPKKSTWD